MTSSCAVILSVWCREVQRNLSSTSTGYCCNTKRVYGPIRSFEMDWKMEYNFLLSMSFTFLLFHFIRLLWLKIAVGYLSELHCSYFITNPKLTLHYSNNNKNNVNQFQHAFTLEGSSQEKLDLVETQLVCFPLRDPYSPDICFDHGRVQTDIQAWRYRHNLILQ